MNRYKYSFLKILTGSDLSRRRLPMMSVDSGRSGPVVWLTACLHGDEVGGMVIIQETFRQLRKRPLRKGKIFAFPLMNPIGFETLTRSIPFSKEDLNRSFPGDPDGSLGERVADLIFSTVVDTRPSVVLDLHNDWNKSIPYALIDPDADTHTASVRQTVEHIAYQTGFISICDEQEIRSSFTHCLLKKGIPALTLEIGESYVVNEVNIDLGVRCVWNILMDFKMVAKDTEPFAYPVPPAFQQALLAYSDKPLCPTSGIIRFLMKPGSPIRKGEKFVKIYNPFGKLRAAMHALQDGIVLGHANTSVAFPGMPVMAFGVRQ